MTNEPGSSAPPMQRPANVLDCALRFFSCAEEEDLCRMVQEANAAKLEEFLDAYRTFVSNGTLSAPPLGKGELRPYFPTQGHDQPAWLCGGVDFDLRALRTSDGMWKAVDVLKHRLLYCHSVAVDDPLPQLVSSAAGENRLGRGYDSMNALQNYMNFLLHMRPLLSKDVLCLVSSPFYVQDYLKAWQGGRNPRAALNDFLHETLDESQIWNNFSIDDILQIAPQDRRIKMQKSLFDDSGKKLLLRSVFTTACERISIAFDALAHTSGRVSAYLPFRYDVNLLKEFQHRITKNQNFNLPDTENWLLANLIDIDLPGVTSLELDELISIRTNSDEFESWRRELREAIMHADCLHKDLWDLDDGVQRAVKDRLKQAKERLEESMPRSKRLSGLQEGKVAILGGVVSASIAYFLDPMGTFNTAIAGLAGTLGSAAVATGLKVNEGYGDKHKAQTAANAHYIAMLR